MPRRISSVAVIVAVGIAFAVTSCSTAPGTVKSAASATRSASAAATASAGVTASPAATVPPGVPAGYKRIGGAAQGISVAAPASWIEINLATQTLKSAVSRLGLSSASVSMLTQQLAQGRLTHAVFVYNIKAAMSSPRGFAPNLSVYCVTSGITEVGSAGVPIIRAIEPTELAKLLGATHVTERDVEVGGVPGLETSYQLVTPSVGTLYGSQLAVLPKPDKGCFVTLSGYTGPLAAKILGVAAATAQFP